jgi:hypothetical protein
MEEGKVFIEPLGGVEKSQGSVENPLRLLGTGEGCFKTLQEYCKNFWEGSAQKFFVLKVFLSGV